MFCVFNKKFTFTFAIMAEGVAVCVVYFFFLFRVDPFLIDHFFSVFLEAFFSGKRFVEEFVYEVG